MYEAFAGLIGSISNNVPSRMTIKKLIRMIWVVDRRCVFTFLPSLIVFTLLLYHRIFRFAMPVYQKLVTRDHLAAYFDIVGDFPHKL